MSSSEGGSDLSHLGLPSNALIDALMGSGIPLPRRQHPEAEVEALLEGIDLCTDVEALVIGVQIDFASLLQDSDRDGHTLMVKSEISSEDTNAEQVPTTILKISARLARIKSLLYKERTTTSHTFAFFKNSQFKTFASALLHSINCDQERKILFPKLLEHLELLPFETRKDVASIFNYLLVCGCAMNGIAGSEQNDAAVESYTTTMLGFVFYVDQHFSLIMSPIIRGHYVSRPGPTSEILADESKDDISSSLSSSTVTLSKPTDLALLCGSMYRSILRHPLLYKKLVSDAFFPHFVVPFLDVLINQANFEVSSDALETFRLVMHPSNNNMAIPTVSLDKTGAIISSLNKIESVMESIASNFLEREFKNIFTMFNTKLLNEDQANYITRRISLQLLSSILLTRSNYNIMIKYISARSNLKCIMMVLSDPSAHISMEAFHVFKVFVVNPKKPNDIIKVLYDNKSKLIKYLTSFHQEKEATDVQFREEKALVISSLEQLDAESE